MGERVTGAPNAPDEVKPTADEREAGEGEGGSASFDAFLREVARTPTPTVEERRRLEPGTRLGPYEVRELLGAGGMGEVYRAHDERLSREVAIKVLPASLRENTAWVRRFEHEARAAGALHHPNVLTVFDVGTHEGMPYLVSEHLVGSPLGRLLREGRIPPRRAAELALQLARGLAAAHGRGIVHRDLKPDNVFVTSDGFVKILDFGLAKLADLEPHMRAAAATATLLTQPGAVLGTAGYMSPEQVRGETVDHRSDVFSFGAILYEMLSGQRAFNAPTSVEVMHAVLKDEPPELSGLAPDVPPLLERVVRHCLAKEPGQRYQSALDVAFHLEAVLASSWPSSPVVTPPTTATAPVEVGHIPSRPRRRRVARVLLVAASILLLVGGGALGGWLISHRATPPAGRLLADLDGVAEVARALEPLARIPGIHGSEHEGLPPAPGGARGAAPVHAPWSFRQLTYGLGFIGNARFSPDAESVIYTAFWLGSKAEIFSSRTDSPESRPLGLREANILSISRMGEMAINMHRGAEADCRGCESATDRNVILSRVPMGGGAPRELATSVWCADWDPDGRELAVARIAKGRTTIEYPLGRVRHAVTGWVSDLRVSPDGRKIAFLLHPTEGDDGGALVLVDDAGGRVLSDGWMSAMGLAWHPGGNEVWFTATREGVHRALHAVTLDGRARLVARMPGTLRLQDISRDLRVLMSIEQYRFEMLIKGPDDERPRDLSWFDASSPKALSADGEQILFDERGEGGGATYSVYVRKTDGSPAVRLGAGWAGGLSRDGKWAMATIPLPEPAQLWMHPTGMGQSRQVTKDAIHHQRAYFLPSGDAFVFEGSEPGRPMRIFAQKVGAPPRAISKEGMRFAAAGDPVSRDGRYVLASRTDGTARQLIPVGEGAPRPLDYLQSSDFVVTFDEDGRHLLGATKRGGLRTVRFDLESGEVSPWSTLALEPVKNQRWGSVIATPDGRSLAFARPRTTSTLYAFEGLR